jgi:hypothetical protein
MKLEIILIIFLIVIVLFISVNYYYQNKTKTDTYLNLNIPNEIVEEKTFTTEIVPNILFTEKELEAQKRYQLGYKGCYINKPLTVQPIDALPFNPGLKECIPAPQMLR